MGEATDRELLVRIDERVEVIQDEVKIIRKYVPAWCVRCRTRWLLLAPVVLVGIGTAVKAVWF